MTDFEGNFYKVVRQLENITGKGVIAITKVGQKRGRFVYAVDFTDGTATDYYINLEACYIEEV